MTAYNYGSLKDRNSYTIAMEEARKEYTQWLESEAQKVEDHKAIKDVFRKLSRVEA